MKKRLSVLALALLAAGVLGACGNTNQDAAASGTSSQVSQNKRSSEKSSSASTSSKQVSSDTSTSSSSTSQSSSSAAESSAVNSQPTDRILRINTTAWDIYQITSAEAKSGARLPTVYILSDGPRFESKGPTEWLYVNTRDASGAQLAKQLVSKPQLVIDGKTLKPLKQYALRPEQVREDHDIMDEYLQWNSHWFIETPTNLYVYQQ
jgi:ABC-type glycerol-3-phosphate transport system substrate-binding protein